jgi:hypothetical protein
VPHKSQLDVPIGMEKIYQRLERWRSMRRGRSPIPKPLWAAAAAVAREHGLDRTSKVLHLEFNKLKGFVESGRPRKRTAKLAPQFVELMAAPPVGVSEWVIELEGRRGKMRIQWKGVTPPDLEGLGRILWEKE